jgi:hypothetical protein
MELLEQLARTEAFEERPESQKLYRDLGYNYVDLARNHLDAGSLEGAQRAIENLSRVLPLVAEPDQSRLSESYRNLQGRLRN